MPDQVGAVFCGQGQEGFAPNDEEAHRAKAEPSRQSSLGVRWWLKYGPRSFGQTQVWIFLAETSHQPFSGWMAFIRRTKY